MRTAKKKTAEQSAKTSPALERLLGRIVVGKRLLKAREGEKLFSQGEKGTAVYFVRKGKVQLTVVSPQGKMAVLANLGSRDFLGEECLVGDSRRTSTATVHEVSTLFRITKGAMLRALHLQPRFTEEFLSSLLGRNLNLEEDLRDQLFDHSERRLACALLKLSLYGQPKRLPDSKLAPVTARVLAKVASMPQAKVAELLNKFTKLGFIDYNGAGKITVKAELLTESVLHD